MTDTAFAGDVVSCRMQACEAQLRLLEVRVHHSAMLPDHKAGLVRNLRDKWETLSSLLATLHDTGRDRRQDVRQSMDRAFADFRGALERARAVVC
ncbi:MAG: hypothetical protein Q7R81_05920 [Candidatus Peregrinibacteria bacterium]|nr:hypothetical protein [Candidatus Peregrinibacteria bacterium]